jgi:hypothetical protein
MIQNSQTLKPKNLDYKKSDLIVFKPTGKHTNGHIAIYSGKQWISDFAQKNPNGMMLIFKKSQSITEGRNIQGNINKYFYEFLIAGVFVSGLLL